MLTPNWSQEKRIVRLRLAITLSLVLLQVTGLFRIPWWGFGLLIAISIFSLAINSFGLRHHWQPLPKVNFFVDQLMTILVLSLSEGALSPLIFLCYIHILSAVVFFGQARVVIPVSAIQTFNVALSTYFASLLGSGPSFTFAIIHILGFLIIAVFLGRPASALHRDAITDPLTGALNRRSGLRLLETWINNQQEFNLIFADLKKFKAINDEYGHAIGDEVLSTMANILKTSVRSDDLVIRYGGDEFLTATKGSPEGVIKRLAKTLEQPIKTSFKALSLEIDFGVASYPDDAESLEDLIMLADEKMFISKRFGDTVTQELDKTV